MIHEYADEFKLAATTFQGEKNKLAHHSACVRLTAREFLDQLIPKIHTSTTLDKAKNSMLATEHGPYTYENVSYWRVCRFEI